VNVFSESVFGELEHVVRTLESSGDRKPIVFRSAKPKGFIAGADLRWISEIQTMEQSTRLVEMGKQTFRNVEHSVRNTIALIDGACLGGGLEFALACGWRVAVVRASTQLGLPESKLGLMPGWGGVQRIVDRIGITEGVRMLLTGDSVDADRALHLGLVDAVFQPDEVDTQLDAFLKSVSDLTTPSSRSDREFDARSRQAWSELGLQLNDPKWTSAQRAVLVALDAGIMKSREVGWAVEETFFFPLLRTAEARDAIARFCTPRSSHEA
jgi:3-hydroxyacyl-CoA dehydrogenase/enoyl-CoA hydratase/3-hydroxybutyryl-CoA epimerase